MTLIADRYELGESIGTGGMSDVYAATDTALGRTVAIKMLKLDMARDESFRERFRREAQNSARLNHPNIVAVFDTGETTIGGLEVPYIVMEIVHGRNLRDIVREDGPLTPHAAAEFMLPVTTALQASHDAGIIHRDIKPANIMVTNMGEVKVMDFGIARALDDATSAMTQTSAVIGTAQYLSPEQARGKPADGRSDIYALGCVMYEAVTGTPPFEGESPFAVAYQHVQEDPVPPSEHISGLAENEAVNIDAVILTAMAKHPADRYQTATEMAEDLQRLMRGSVTQAARTHLAYNQPAQDRGTYQDATIVSGSAVAARPVEVLPEEDDAWYADEPATSRYVEHRRANEKTSGASWMQWVAALLGLVLAGTMAYMAYNFFTDSGGRGFGLQETMVEVPELAGMTRAEAVSTLEGMGLQVALSDTPSPDVPRGEVLGTNPTAGSQLRPGTLVTVSVSSGRELTDVPDVTGLNPQDAAAALADADLELNTQLRSEFSEDVPEGDIISQNPAAGSQLSKGSQVSVVVSKGHERVTVPSLVGMDVNQASAMLTSMDLRAAITEVDSEKPEGEVVAAAGENTDVETGTAIELRVSNGMLMRMVDIGRMNPREADDALRRAGWRGRLIAGPTVPTGAAVDQGLIGHQSVEPGQTIRRDQDIRYNLWEFDPLALLPRG
ncbi:Stk1 family PASTA domain-containing Ser/Thr kinase [Corynebacterium sp.]|uniref:Stk1 family PASTA domain-containing Ser/Thr kinase n=1 Tax=Corynebacterium sp. TaxID=1720 RepID=UPI002A912CFC|nr:Stk1 family PASTA domain-containing Ser/Thr kinase [Corynebacterium sp.]MDY5785605.1 Stk1 family PASTA domain-containing Ser/Thr kinase [Corynebacterium sp.]